jgi:hypothetical protein
MELGHGSGYVFYGYVALWIDLKLDLQVCRLWVAQDDQGQRGFAAAVIEGHGHDPRGAEREMTLAVGAPALEATAATAPVGLQGTGRNDKPAQAGQGAAYLAGDGRTDLPGAAAAEQEQTGQDPGTATSHPHSFTIPPAPIFGSAPVLHQ